MTFKAVSLALVAFIWLMFNPYTVSHADPKPILPYLILECKPGNSESIYQANNEAYQFLALRDKVLDTKSPDEQRMVIQEINKLGFHYLNAVFFFKELEKLIRSKISLDAKTKIVSMVSTKFENLGDYAAESAAIEVLGASFDPKSYDSNKDNRTSAPPRMAIAGIGMSVFKGADESQQSKIAWMLARAPYFNGVLGPQLDELVRIEAFELQVKIMSGKDIRNDALRETLLNSMSKMIVYENNPVLKDEMLKNFTKVRLDTKEQVLIEFFLKDSGALERMRSCVPKVGSLL